MIKIKTISRLSIICLIVLALSGSILTTNAQEIHEYSADECLEIIFAVDCSNSMKKYDPSFMIYDFIREITASVPSHSKVGVVVYGNDIKISDPPDSKVYSIDYYVNNINYKGYGDAGAGLAEAITHFTEDPAEKRVVIVSDGEILMDTEKNTLSSADKFDYALKQAEEKGIIVDVVTFGEVITEGKTVYHAAEQTGGEIYTFKDANDLSIFGGKYLFDILGLNSRSIGRLSGKTGELKINLPDCYMDKATIILTGKQDSENMGVICESEKMSVETGQGFTAITLEKPLSDQISISMASDQVMDIYAYLTSEYMIVPSIAGTYDLESEKAQIKLDLKNNRGDSLLTGHLKQEKPPVIINGENLEYVKKNNEIYLEFPIKQSQEINAEIKLDDFFGNYYGETQIGTLIDVPVVVEEEPPVDWFLWSLVIVFVLGLVVIFLIFGRRKKYNKTYMRNIDRRVELPDESRPLKKEFDGKILIYVIRNKEDIDYPPESINLFARCRRETITLQWLLDTSGIPLEVEGADRIIFRAGEDRVLFVKNSSKATAIKGREVMLKNHQYPVFFHEKITFIFEKDGVELEIHYRDLK